MIKKNQMIYDALDEKTKEDVKKLVIARIKASSDDLGISIGSTHLTKEQLIESVEENNDIGREIIEIQLEYLKDMASGAIYQQTNE